MICLSDCVVVLLLCLRVVCVWFGLCVFAVVVFVRLYVLFGV